VIDLHLHTTASDGRLTPEALVARAASVGLTIISVTDHDTTAGIPEASVAARRHGLRLVHGIEITAVEGARDIHVLGYFIDRDHAPLVDFLRGQRADRLRRLTTMTERLRELGYAVEAGPLIAAASRSGGRTIGRPQLADVLVTAGYVVNRREAFDTLLGEGRPAFVPRSGATVGEVSAIVRAAGGVASLAHPGLIKRDEAIPGFVAAGLLAVEVWHSDHDAAAIARYLDLAERLGIGMSGGSDYHADHSHHAVGLGAVTVPEAVFADLEARAGRAAGSY
jgi:predicted metal-dependent phosphoesterase TrpH